MTTESPAELCDYCGKTNPEGLSFCAGCGTALVSEPPPPASTEPRRKSKTLAIILSVVFGPFGLIYVGGWWQMAVMVVICMPLLLLHKASLLVIFGSRAVAAGLAYNLAEDQDDTPNSQRDAGRLLDKAARLENVDFQKAIAGYEQIVREYPDTRAAKVAARAIETLKRSA